MMMKSSFLSFFLLACLNSASRSSNVLAGQLQSPDVQMHGSIEQVPKEVEFQGCPRLSLPELSLAKSAVEPKTGIEFPVVLDNLSAGDRNSGFSSEVSSQFTKFTFLALVYFMINFSAPCSCIEY